MPPGGVLSRRPTLPPRRRTMAPPRDLFFDVIEEILLRLPPSDPGALVRAALACPHWWRIISSPNFLARYRERHGAATLLGVISNLRTEEGEDFVRFEPFWPSKVPRRFDLDGCRALDARHGCILLAFKESAPLVVFDPCTREYREVPALPELAPECSWNAAFLGSGSRSGGDYQVVVLHEDPVDITTVFNIYSSVTSSWSRTATNWASLAMDDIPPTLVRNIVYFSLDAVTRVVGFDLDTKKSNRILPPTEETKSATLFCTLQETLGFASVVLPNVCLWGWNAADETWSMTVCLDLDSAVLFSEYLSCAPTFEVVLLGGEDGVCELEIHSGRICKKTHCSNIRNLIPYVSEPLFMLAPQVPNENISILELVSRSL